MGIFTAKFWKDISSLGIYSKEDSSLLSDQYDAGAPGGGNSSDADPDEKGSADESDNDIGLDMGDDTGEEDDISMGEDGTSDEGGDDMSSDDSSGDSSMDTGANSSDPNKNPFKNQNGKSLLDDELAKLQTTVTDTLDRIYANPKIEQVVVSELENLADSIRNIRETVFVVPVDATLYKYQLSVSAYNTLAEEIRNSFNEE